MNNLKTYCVTDIVSNKLEKLNLTLASVGKKKFPENYINCKNGDNIEFKEEYYSELTFHYWFWKNKLQNFDENIWLGFCQKRRFWLKNDNLIISNLNDLNNNILRTIPEEWEKYDVILCEPINVSPAKKVKMIKRGWKNLIKDPTIFFNDKKQTIKLQFDMHHGYGILDKAINVMNEKDREDFRKFVNNRIKFSPHIMFISKKKIANDWFKSLFKWLYDCEKIFGFKDLTGYDQNRLYAYLSERYLPFWFEKYYKIKLCPWVFFDTEK